MHRTHPSDRPQLRVEPLEDRLAPAAGDLDPTFGTGGVVLDPLSTPSNSLPSVQAVAALPDDGVVVAGSAFADGERQAFAAAKLRPDGSLDPAFGTGGRVRVTFTGAYPPGVDVSRQRSDAVAVAVQPDGKIILAGSAKPDDGNVYGLSFAAVRLNPDGSLDPSFGTGGRVVIGFAGNQSGASAVAVQPDGKIVLVGQTATDPNNPQNTDFVIARLNADGSIDATFDGDGKLVIAFDLGTVEESNFADSANAVVVQPDGKIIVAGSAELGNRPQLAPQAVVSNADVAAVRLNPDGSLDGTFDGDGKLTLDLGLSDFASSAALQPDGKIVLAGYSGTFKVEGRAFVRTDRAEFAVVRLNLDGSRDGTFGVNGQTVFPVGSGGFDQAFAVAVQPTGQIVAAGLAAISGSPYGYYDVKVAAARLNPDGSLDGTYGTGGKVVSPVGGAAVDVALQPLGGVVAAVSGGWVVSPVGELAMPAVVRLQGNPINPGAVLAGGRPDGSAVVLSPTDGQYAVADVFQFFAGFSGTVRTATADVTGDGVPDYVGGAGPGGGPGVVIFDGKTGAEVVSLLAFEGTFTGGVFVAAADLNGDGRAEVVVTPDQGGGPVVAVYDGAALAAGVAGQLARFFGIDDPAFRGGARAALGDLNANGSADLIVSAGFLGGPRVAVFDGKSVAAGDPVKLVADFFAFEPGLRNGAFVAAGDVTGDGFAEVAFGGGPGGAPRVRLFDGKALLAAGPFSNLDEVPTAQFANFFVGDSALRGGVRLALRDLDGDGRADLLAGSGEGEPSRVRVYAAGNLLANSSPTPDQELDPFGAVLADGVFVG